MRARSRTVETVFRCAKSRLAGKPSHVVSYRMSAPVTFKALRTYSEAGRIESRVESMRLDDLSHGEVLVRVRYAGVNYKDCLSLLGQAKIIMEFPRIAGIELVGEVVDSPDPRFAAGQYVLVHGHQTGIAFDGGFAEYARVPTQHLQAIPEGLTPHEAAILGVPAFTVAMCVERFIELGVTADSGPIALSGAGGAVGLMALGVLPRAGFRVSAMTRRMEHADALKDSGASEVIDAAILQQSQRPLEKARFADLCSDIAQYPNRNL